MPYKAFGGPLSIWVHMGEVAALVHVPGMFVRRSAGPLIEDERSQPMFGPNGVG